MKKIMLIGALSIAVTLTGCNQMQKKEAVNTEIIEPKEEQTLELYGVIKESNTKKLVIDFPVTIGDIYVKDGDLVVMGQPILALDLGHYRNTISIKNKEIEALSIKLKTIEKDLDSNVIQAHHIESQIVVKKRLLENGTDPDLLILANGNLLAQEHIKQLEKTYAMEQEMYEVGGSAKIEVEAIEQKLTDVKINMTQLELEVDKLKSDKNLEIENLQIQLDQYNTQATNNNKKAELDAKALQIEIQILQIVLAEMEAKLVKPYIKEDKIICYESEAIVDGLLLEKGELAGEQATSVCRLINQNDLIISVDVPQSFISRIKEGTEGVARLSGEDESVDVKIVRIAQSARKVNGENMIEVELRTNHHKSEFKLGYEVDLFLKLSQ